MQCKRFSLLCPVFFIAQTLFAHEEIRPGVEQRNGPAILNARQPAEHPGQLLLRSDKGNLNSGSNFSSGGPFAAQNIEFLAQLTLAGMGAGTGIKGNDIWGWTDQQTGKEYALVGRSDGTAFVDVSDPMVPLYLGFLPTFTGNTAWRDIKVYADHAYVVSDNNGAHGMQVFDLTQLRSVRGPPVTFNETAHYSGFREAHNIAINEVSGFAYAVGTETFRGGMHFVDITDPASPAAAGGFSADGFTHDAQVVTYSGPDTAYADHEIAFNSNTDTLTIVDVTDKNNPIQLSRTGYAASAYTHQGWLTADHRYFLSNDELDERNDPDINFTRTHLWGVADLDAPIYMGFYEATVQSIDHNLYTHRGLVFEANYTSGMRVLDLSDIASGNLTEVAWIDTHPAIDSLSSFEGVWSIYPYFASGTVIIGDRNEGLITVRLALPDQDGDGLDDLLETSLGTDPLLMDSDGDGLTDHQEVDFDGNAQVYTPGSDTDPLSMDTDLDGYTDGLDPLPLVFNFADGDIAPLGAPDGQINAADYLIAVRVTLGHVTASALELSHGDVYPPGAPDGLLNMSDLLLIRQLLE
jgi:choice-of-anchor B domain-containing protein